MFFIPLTRYPELKCHQPVISGCSRDGEETNADCTFAFISGKINKWVEFDQIMKALTCNRQDKLSCRFRDTISCLIAVSSHYPSMTRWWERCEFWPRLVSTHCRGFTKLSLWLYSVGLFLIHLFSPSFCNTESDSWNIHSFIHLQAPNSVVVSAWDPSTHTHTQGQFRATNRPKHACFWTDNLHAQHRKTLGFNPTSFFLWSNSAIHHLPCHLWLTVFKISLKIDSFPYLWMCSSLLKSSWTV